jgi:hypothetical protein
VSETGAVSMLDYGSGSGRQYFDEKFHACWAEKRPVLYEPPARKPSGVFDGVICTDMLSRVSDRQSVCDDLCAYAVRFLFVVIPKGMSVDFTVREGCRLEIREN